MKKNKFVEHVFSGEYDKSNEIYSEFCNTICRIGLAYRIEILTSSEEVNDGNDCYCCSYTVTTVENIRVIMSMKGKYEMEEWYDYEIE